MTRNFSTQITDQLASDGLRPFYLLKLELPGGDTLITDCDTPIYFDSEEYKPRGFQFSSASYSMSKPVDKITIKIDNVDVYFTDAFVGGLPSGSTVTLSLVVLDSTYIIVDNASATIFTGEIDSWSITEVEIKIVVTNLFYQWIRRTQSPHSSSCRWHEFKGTECGYSGSGNWCDRTYARCETLGNTTRFGGFRWLASIVDKDIWWGRDQK